MSHFEYSRWDGTQAFRPLSADAAFDRIADYLLEHGDHILRRLDATDDADALHRLLRDGYLERDEHGQLVVTPRGLRRIEQKALEELFTVRHRGTPGQHATDFTGAGPARPDATRPYEFGDPVANLDLHETLRNAARRRAAPGTLDVAEADLVVHETEYATGCATALLLDMSGSMARYGKFYHAKKVALGLLGLARGRYREDTLTIIGFYSAAAPLTERELLLATPKPVSIFDSRVFRRVPLDAPPADVPEHFTNIQAGLRLAREWLRRQPAANKQILCVTDGEPTAHVEGRELVLVYPPGDRTARATLQEVEACRRAGIEVSTFALIEDYFCLELRNFVDLMARTARGRAVYCNAGELGGCVLDSFVRGRSSRRRLG
jgi:uncharacterized protein with von Willebrand factor type A (vWA) domain